VSHADGAAAPDPYYKKTITYRYCRKELRFDVSQDLFSSFQIDVGTQFLIRSLTQGCTSRYRKVLDLGCGYGPLGLTLKVLNDATQVHMVDRDALAVEFCHRNIALNHLTGVETYGSLDYSDIRGDDFDLVVSNIPGKAGESVITQLLQGAYHHLAPEGVAAVVAVKPLEPVIESILGEDPNIEILERKSRSAHSVFHYRFRRHHGGAQATPRDEIEAGPYFRGSASFSALGREYRMQTVYGLPEFDQLSYATGLLLDGVKRHVSRTVDRCLIHNPGIGHIPVVLWNTKAPAHVSLVDRDLLSLRYSRRNLILNGCPAGGIAVIHAHTVSAAPHSVDLALGVLRESEGTEAVAYTFRQMADSLAPPGVLLLAGSSTAVTRLVERELRLTQLKVRERERYRGFSLLAAGA